MENQELLAAIEAVFDKKIEPLKEELKADTRKQGILLEAHISDQRDLGSYIKSIYEDVKIIKKDMAKLKLTSSTHDLAIRKQFHKSM